jgi:putative intracellular protease/amidase
MRVLLSSTVALALAFGPGPFGSSFASPAVATSAAATDRLVLPAPKVGRSRPLVIVVADSAGAETTDFIIPYGVLKDSGVADVRTLLTRAGPVPLKMALNVLADSTIGQFDTAEPASADVVIVPAQMSPKDPVLSAWIRGQAAKGATIVSICEGARVLANAGLLDDKRVTTHWHALKSLEKSYPATFRMGILFRPRGCRPPYRSRSRWWRPSAATARPLIPLSGSGSPSGVRRTARLISSWRRAMSPAPSAQSWPSGRMRRSSYL